MTSVDSLSVARAVADALIEAGMRDAVVCPGSRSAPLAYALAERERAGSVRLHVRVDERSAGFLAHGLSLASGRPVGVLTTSGTAVGNLLPALMESFHAGTRVIALTADRPTELHGTGANQTTSQEGVFALHVRHAASIGCDAPAGRDADAHLRAVGAVVHRALLAADGVVADGAGHDDGGHVPEPGPVTVGEAPAGPVHLNLQFRAPLVPAPDEAAAMGSARQSAPQSPADPASEAAVHSAYQAPGALLSGFPELDVARLTQRRTVVLACHGAGPVAAAFALALGLPLLAEPSSNARFSVDAIAAYPLLLGSAGGRGPDSHPLAGRIERVVLFGRPTLTRPVTALLAREDVETVLFAPEPAPWFEPGRRRERPIETLEELADFAGHGEAGWLSAWQRASMRAQAAVEDVLVAEDLRHGLSPQSVAQVGAAVTRGPLVLGSSSVIRDVDLTWRPPTAPDAEVYANRGLAGIDGTVSTAAGVALARGMRTVALLGDLTALHDVGGLLVGPTEVEPDLELVVVNDDGGAIFAGLEHGAVAAVPGLAAPVERLFATPHGVDVAALAAAYGIPHVAVSDRVGLIHCLADPVRGRRIVEVRCSRADRPRVAAALAEAVRATFPAAADSAPADTDPAPADPAAEEAPQ